MDVKPPHCIYGSCIIQQRYILTLMLLLSITIFCSVRHCLAISLTKIAMELPPPSEITQYEICPKENESIISVEGGSYNWTETQQGFILLSFFPGYLLTHIPGGIVADQYGGKYLLAGGVFMSALASLVTPIIITSLDWIGLSSIRFFLGLMQGPLFPAITALLSHWVPERERSTLGGWVFSGAFLGAVTGNLLSGFLMVSFKNWPVVFYFWGVMALIWVMLFLPTCYSKPSEHPFITTEEAEFLQSEIGDIKHLKTPWKTILKDPAVLALIILQIGHDWILYTFLSDFPKFLTDVLKFNISKLGIVTGVTYGLMWAFSIIFGWISDYLTNNKFTNIGKIRKVYAVISTVGPSVCSVVAVHMGCDGFRVVTAFWVGMILMGPWFPGPKMNCLDISKHFSGFIMSVSNGAGVISGIMTPYVIAIVAPHGTLKEWRLIFWVALFISVFTLVIYLKWGSAERSQWDLTPEEVH